MSDCGEDNWRANDVKKIKLFDDHVCRAHQSSDDYRTMNDYAAFYMIFLRVYMISFTTDIVIICRFVPIYFTQNIANQS